MCGLLNNMLNHIKNHSHLYISLAIGFIAVAVFNKPIYEFINWLLLDAMKELVTNLIHNEVFVSGLAVSLSPLITKILVKFSRWIKK